MKNLLIVLSGPSGVGKGTVLKMLMARGDYALSISCTTRKPRKGERNGKSYFFISKKKFENLIEKDGFLEYSHHFDNYYGTPKKFVEKTLKKKDVILEIEVDGALNVKKAHPEAVLIMILPPDENALRARLAARHSEDAEKIEKRVERMNYELSKKNSYDYVIINDVLDTCVDELENIIKKEKGNDQ